jgi:hypothetical protein
MQTDRGHDGLELSGKEIVVLENSEDPEVIDDAQPKKKFSLSPVGRGHHETIKKIQQGTQCQEPHELVTPPSVEEIAGSQDQQVLPKKRSSRCKPVQEENHREKKQEFKGIEQHERKRKYWVLE